MAAKRARVETAVAARRAAGQARPYVERVSEQAKPHLDQVRESAGDIAARLADGDSVSGLVRHLASPA